MVAHRERDLLIDVGCDQLRGPVAVIGADETGGGAVVHQAGEDHLLVAAVLQRKTRALQHVRRRPEPVVEKIEQGWPRRHLRQARIVPHEMQPTGGVLARRRIARIALA